MTFEGKLARAKAAKKIKEEGSDFHKEKKERKRELRADPRYKQMKSMANYLELHEALKMMNYASSYRKSFVFVRDFTEEIGVDEEKLQFEVRTDWGDSNTPAYFLVRISTSEGGIKIESHSSSHTVGGIYSDIDSFLNALSEAMA